MPNFSFYIPDNVDKTNLLDYVRFLSDQKLLSEIVVRALESTKQDVIQEIICKLEAELDTIRKFSVQNKEIYARVMAERVNEREDAIRELTVLWDRYISKAQEPSRFRKLSWIRGHKNHVRAIGDNPEEILSILEGR